MGVTGKEQEKAPDTETRGRGDAGRKNLYRDYRVTGCRRKTP